MADNNESVSVTDMETENQMNIELSGTVIWGNIKFGYLKNRRRNMGLCFDSAMYLMKYLFTVKYWYWCFVASVCELVCVIIK